MKYKIEHEVIERKDIFTFILNLVNINLLTGIFSVILFLILSITIFDFILSLIFAISFHIFNCRALYSLLNIQLDKIKKVRHVIK